jgi:hypothetical protein
MGSTGLGVLAQRTINVEMTESSHTNKPSSPEVQKYNIVFDNLKIHPYSLLDVHTAAAFRMTAACRISAEHVRPPGSNNNYRDT